MGYGYQGAYGRHGYGGAAVRVPIDPAAAALLARMSAPTPARQRLINNVFRGLRAYDILPTLDYLAFYPAHDDPAGLLNWVSASYNPVLMGVPPPIFTVDRGFTGNGTGYINSGFNPVAAAGHFQRDACHMGYWHSAAFTGGNRALGGNRNDRIYQGSGVIASVAANFASGAGNITGNNGGRGYHCYSRNNGATFDYLHHDQPMFTDRAQVSTGLENSFFLGLAYSNGATPTGFANTRLEVQHWGGPLTRTQMVQMRDIVAGYVVGVGAYP